MYIFGKIVNEVPPELGVLNVLTHFLDSRDDFFGIIPSELFVEELLHVIMLLTGEAKFFSLITSSFILNHGKAAHVI